MLVNDKNEPKFTKYQIRRIGYRPDSKFAFVNRLPIGDFFIGRISNGWNYLNLPGCSYVSKCHCRIECFEDGKVLLHDSSTNGTFVNGKKIEKSVVKLEKGDLLGIGYNVTRLNTFETNTKYGFVVEEVIIKQEIKEEPEDNNNECVEESTLNVPETTENVEINEKMTLESQVSVPIVATSESFEYLQQMTPVREFTVNDAYENTQSLLADLMESPKRMNSLPEAMLPPPLTTPPPSPQPVILSENPEEMFEMSPEGTHLSQISSDIDQMLCDETDLQANLSLISSDIDQMPFDETVDRKTEVVQMLKNTDLNEILTKLIEIYGIDVLFEKFKQIIEELDNPKDKEKVSHNSKKSKKTKKSQKKTKKKETRKLTDDPEFVKALQAAVVPAKVSKRVRHRRNSLDLPPRSKETKAGSMSHRRKSVNDEPGSQSILQADSEDDRVSGNHKRKSREMSYENVSSDDNSPIARRRRLDFHETLKNIRPVPPTKNIEELYDPNELPPALEVVPEPKEPEFTYRLSNKTKKRVAHNKVTKTQETPKKARNEEEKSVTSTGEPNIPETVITIENSPPVPEEEPQNPLLSDVIDALTVEDSEETDSEPIEIPLSPLPTSSDTDLQPPLPEPTETFQTQSITDEVNTILDQIDMDISDDDLPSIIPSKPPTPDIGQLLDRAKDLGLLAAPNSPQISNKSDEDTDGDDCIQILSSQEESRGDPRLQNGIKFAMSKPSVPNFVSYNPRNILSDILNEWEIEFLQKDNLPIFEELMSKRAMSVEKSFHSYEHYVTTLATLMKMELFQTLVDAYSQNSDKTFQADVKKTNNFTISKFNWSSLESYRCEFTTRSHKQHQEALTVGLLVVITSIATQKQYFGYITRVSDLRNHTVSDLNLIVSDKFCVESSRSIRICLLKNIRYDLDKMSRLSDVKESPLLPLLLNPKNIDFDRRLESPSEYVGLEKLDGDQFAALSVVTGKIERKRDQPHIFLIEGGPGTGKTRLIVNMIVHLLRNPDTVTKEYRILVCAQNKSAVEVLKEKFLSLRSRLNEEREIMRIVCFGESTLMFGIKRRLHAELAIEKEKLIDRKFDCRREMYPNWKNNLRAIEKSLEELEKMDDFNTLFKNFENLNVCKKKKILKCANIVICPLSTNLEAMQHFDIAIIDEATMATENSCLMALDWDVKHLVLLGDLNQTTTDVRNPKARELGLAKSLFARLASNTPDYLKLRSQYRMHPEILKFTNEHFYWNRIKNAVKIDPAYNLKPYCVFEVENNNIDFVNKLVHTVKYLTKSKEYSIGVVVTNDKQKMIIQEKIGASNLIKKSYGTVLSSDEIQGIEKDIIIYCCSSSSEILPLTYLNIALTRGRKSLFICGNFGSLREQDVWEKLVQDAKNRRVFIDMTGFEPPNLTEVLLNYQKKLSD